MLRKIKFYDCNCTCYSYNQKLRTRCLMPLGILSHCFQTNVDNFCAVLLIIISPYCVTLRDIWLLFLTETWHSYISQITLLFKTTGWTLNNVTLAFHCYWKGDAVVTVGKLLTRSVSSNINKQPGIDPLCGRLTYWM